MDLKAQRDTEEHDIAVQRLYARWLDAGTRLSFALSLAAFLLYLSGLLPAYLPRNRLPELWGLPVDQMLARTGVPVGWSWLGLVGYGDYLNLACVALIGFATPLCYLRILPLLLRLGERLQAALAMLQVAVLLAAASGLFGG